MAVYGFIEPLLWLWLLFKLATPALVVVGFVALLVFGFRLSERLVGR